MHNEDMSEKLPATKGDLRQLARNFGKELIATRVALDKRIDSLESVLKTSYSEIMRRMDQFMAQTLRVQRDQVFVVHRLDSLETRVTALEKRTRP